MAFKYSQNTLLKFIHKLQVKKILIMKVRTIISILFCFAITNVSLFSQTFFQPNIGLKSPPTLEIKRIEISAEKTLVSMTIENQIVGGTYCADKNIYIIYPDGSRISLTRAVGIPQCPNSYKFTSIGEKLQFTLEFPPLKTGTKWIDIIEECTSNCFWIYGITLDKELNNKLDESFILASKGDPAKTMLLFRNILESVDSLNFGLEGSLYINIINAAVEAGDKVEAAVWYKRLISSQAPRLSEYVKFLNERGISF
jgi:hypothetical protein